jgi:hypothetical protein
VKMAQLGQSEKLVKEVVLILDPWEANHVARAMIDYAEVRRKNKRLTALVDDLGLASMFY